MHAVEIGLMGIFMCVCVCVCVYKIEFEWNFRGRLTFIVDSSSNLHVIPAICLSTVTR